MSHIVELEKTAWEGLTDSQKKLFSEGENGKYSLDITTLENVENVKTLKSALDKERSNVKEKEKAIKAWEALGKKPEEIAELLKKLAAEEEEAKKALLKDKQGKEPNPLEEQMKKLLEEQAALRKEYAEMNAREKQRAREALISKQFEGYSEEQKADFLLLVKGETEEEIAESVKALKERYPLAKSKVVGGPSNPPPRDIPKKWAYLSVEVPLVTF